MWDFLRNLTPGGLGDIPVRVQVVFPVLPAPRRFYWLVVDAKDVDLSLTDPGRDVVLRRDTYERRSSER